MVTKSPEAGDSVEHGLPGGVFSQMVYDGAESQIKLDQRGKKVRFTFPSCYLYQRVSAQC